MAVERPTFSESWYRVADIRPRLRSATQIRRQHFRGQAWYVVQDSSSNQFFRLNDAGYRFVGLLDGRRTVAEVWRICNEQLGDGAPTQGEAIQLLGQLYTSNLLQAELPPDAEGLLGRYRQRRSREVRGYMMNLLFIRIPILDPDHFLNRWLGIFRRIFTWYGFVAWAILLATGLYFAIGHWNELASQSEATFSAQRLAANLPLMYLGFILAKVVHEFGHAFACKRFGRASGTGGEVHVMGIMFLIFMPMPYVDASSAWALRSKWRRITVGAAGMFVELALASAAAIVWANTSPGDIRALAFNVMFVASASTLLFNGNPLLRYDAYYILSDLLEIPNLSQRANAYLSYLVRKYAWKARQPVNPAHTTGEKAWFVSYGIASLVYRVVICVGILLFVADKLFRLGFILAVAATIAWVLVPLGKLVRYLATSGELARVRRRAVGSTLAATAMLIIGFGMAPAPDHFRVDGIVEPVRLAMVHAQVDGFVESFLPSGNQVGVNDPAPLVRLSNPSLSTQREGLLAERQEMVVRRRLAESEGNAAAVQALAIQVEAVDEQIHRADEQLSHLNIRAPLAGTWIAPDIDRRVGGYLKRGEMAGMVASSDEVLIRATAEQEASLAEAGRNVQIRVRGQPENVIEGVVREILPAGQEQLPSAALGYAAGGSIPTAPDDRQGTKAAERFFEIRISPVSSARLLSGQRVVVRLETPPTPLMRQWWRSLLQLFQRRYQM